MSEKEKLVVSAAVSRKGKKILACAKAFKLSQELDLSLKKIGNICDKNDIKIVSCQLGCF
jgi:hypothetical protein